MLYSKDKFEIDDYVKLKLGIASELAITRLRMAWADSKSRHKLNVEEDGIFADAGTFADLYMGAGEPIRFQQFVRLAFKRTIGLNGRRLFRAFENQEHLQKEQAIHSSDPTIGNLARMTKALYQETLRYVEIKREKFKNPDSPVYMEGASTPSWDISNSVAAPASIDGANKGILRQVICWDVMHSIINCYPGISTGNPWSMLRALDDFKLGMLVFPPGMIFGYTEMAQRRINVGKSHSYYAEAKKRFQAESSNTGIAKIVARQILAELKEPR